jgi:hypothetical protein
MSFSWNVVIGGFVENEAMLADDVNDQIK